MGKRAQVFCFEIYILIVKQLERWKEENLRILKQFYFFLSLKQKSRSYIVSCFLCLQLETFSFWSHGLKNKAISCQYAFNSYHPRQQPCRNVHFKISSALSVWVKILTGLQISSEEFSKFCVVVLRLGRVFMSLFIKKSFESFDKKEFQLVITA